MRGKTAWAYLAGFLDGDGSIYVRMKPSAAYRFGFQIAPTVTFFQSKKERDTLTLLQEFYGIGYLRDRNDGIVEWVVGAEVGITTLLTRTLPFLRIKRSQARLMLAVLDAKSKMTKRSDFVRIARMVERFRELNYSKKRKVRVY